MPEKIIVIHSDGKIEPFKPRFISKTIIKETNIDEELAEKIQRRISNKFYKLQKDGMKEISTAAIRAEVSSQLLQEREFNAEEQSRKLGMSVAEFENLLNNGCKDNANIFFSPEQVAKYAFDSIAKEHALLTMPKQCSEAHRNGYIHIHDLEYFSTRSNCSNWSIPFVARNGLKVDGKGEYGSVAGPAKSLEVLLNQMLEFFMCGSLVLSGGQSWSSFNIYLAPFARNRTYKDIKQAIQNFIFNCNCALIAKGQTVFSSINIEFEVPDFLKNEPAIGPLGVDVGVYGDYEKEAKLIFKAIIDVTKEKDYIGRFHTFPNQIYMIRENTLDSYNDEVKMVHELLSENPTIYFSNVAKENAVTMGCRTRMSQTFTGDYEKDCMNVGNFHYTTINLPLIAHESKNLHEFFETLKYYMDVSKDVLLDRKKRVEDVWYNKHMSDFLLQKDIKTGKQLFEIERCSFSIGICGLNECCLELTGHEIQDEYELAEEICSFMNDVLQYYKDQDGLRWTLFFSPSESTAHRFALINKNKYSDAYVQGTSGNYYLTNSNHIDVKSDINLVAHIQNADLLHPYAVAGAICHIWCRDTHPDPEALYSLNKKIAKTNVKFWAFTNDYTYCLDCGFTIQKAEDKCLKCESDNIVTMSRITGYYQPVNGFNSGKQQEFKDRYRHEV